MTAGLSARAIKIESRVGGRRVTLIDDYSVKLCVTLGVRGNKSFIDRSLLRTIQLLDQQWNNQTRHYHGFQISFPLFFLQLRHECFRENYILMSV